MKIKNIVIEILFLTLATTANSAELVCKGQQREDAKQRPIFVDCANRGKVVDALGSSWRAVKKQGIGGGYENACWKSFARMKELNPAVDTKLVAPGMFARCNVAMQYVK